MKKTLLFFVLPWTVLTSTASVDTMEGPIEVYSYSAQYRPEHGDSATMQCGNNQESCAVFVEAMNNAYRLIKLREAESNEGYIHQEDVRQSNEERDINTTPRDQENIILPPSLKGTPNESGSQQGDKHEEENAK